ncbi:MAG: formate C-acetyltransferase/glycerol dehydratase family glycyl radical enzyme [Peptococcaceae bacterium]|nr:formate C-acetyltransferase/glycerol dehydratase family glycyl radical enzyme [Peptococcaceae bacterium]
MERVGMKAGSRVSMLRERMLTTPEICIERGYLMTESYKETEGYPEVIRRAKALEKILKEMTIFIEDGELIVGRGSSKRRAGILSPELNWEWYLEEMDLFSTREWDRFAPLTEEEKAKMREFLPYWKGKALKDRWVARVPESAQRLNNLVQFGGAFCGNNQYYGHVGVDYERVLTKGLNGIKKDVDEALGKLNLADVKDLDRYHFLKAVNITLEAAAVFAERYAELAAGLAKQETDRQRKAELETIAGICSRVPANPARSFYEALQSIWFTYLVLMIESPGTGIGFLRPDQYLYPFYKKDLEEGRITKEEALELIALFYIKTNGLVIPYPAQVAKIFAGFTLGANFTLGGLTKDGKDAVNELSYLFLEAEKVVGLNSEDIIIRIHKKTPDAFVMKACEVAKLLRGKLKFVSDETIIQQLLQDGKPVECARIYGITGCNSPTVPGHSLDIPGGMCNLPLMLELALNNGVSRMTGEQIGSQTGDPRKFKSYDEVWEAYKKQVEALLPVCLLFKNADKQIFAEYAQSPFQSALYHGCIEKGVDVINGGTAPYISHAMSLSGAPNVGDSLAAIKKVVFEDKKITMDRLIDALDKNFAGEEEVLHLLKGAPKFGNDDDYVDSIVNEVLVHGSNVAARVKGFAGAVSNVAAATITANIPMGYVVGALPDGRKAGEPIAEGGISPCQGRNVSGPTATMMSVAKLDHLKLTNGSVLNMRFSPDALKDEAKMRKFASLIRTYLETGGFFVQFNIVSTDMLRDAQRYPEKYRDLLVRVSTYSAYFVELSPELQNDIIARMEFQEV